MARITLDVLREHKIIGIVRGIPLEQLLPLVSALREGGIRMVEVTFGQTSTDHFSATTQAIQRIAADFPDLYVGAGTVLNIEQTRLAHEAGAQYIISPNVCCEVIQETKKLGMMSLPGAFTPTEIAWAYHLGADAVKVFPAGNLGPDYIKAIRAPLKQIPLVAVGGVDEKNVGDFLNAGAIGAGVGGSLVKAAWVKDGSFDKISQLAQAFVAACKTGGGI